MPRLNEGDLLIEAVRIPSASLEGAVPASTQIENILKTVPRGPAGLLQDRPARDRQRRDGRAPDRRLDDAQAAGRVAAGPDPRRPDRGDGQGAHRERPGREVRLQPADRDAGQRAGRGRQERRGRAALRARPRRAPPEGDRDRAGARADPGAQDIKTPTSGRLPMLRDLGPPRPARAVRDQGGRRARRRRRAGRHDGRHRLRGGRAGGTPSRSGCPSRGGTTPRRSGRSGSSTPRAGRSRCATWPTSTFEEGPSEVERENVQRRAVVGRQRPGPRHRRLRRRGAGRDRRRRSSSPPATSSAGAASSSTCRPPRSGS